MNNKIVIISCIGSVMLLINLLVSSCFRLENEYADIDVYFSAEKLSIDGKNLYAENDSNIIFKGAHKRTNKTSHSGGFSYITSPKNRFSLNLTIPQIKPYSLIHVSVWRKGKDNKSHLVIKEEPPSKFYRSTNKAVEFENGWEKLQLDFYLPQNNTNGEFKVYIWNNSDDTVYIDDYAISIKSKFNYPSFKEEALFIEIDTTEYMSLLETRKRAFDVGVLLTEKDDWVKGYVFGENKLMKAKLRLKGDWIGHLYENKWSFRLKIKGDNSWHRMKVFSVQNPKARYGASEWFLHKVFQSQDILATRYGFVPVYLNNKSLGIYAWEEHFTKQLIESQNKRQGPILKFFEDIYWDQTRMTNGKKDNIDLPYFEAAVIKPFSPSKILEDSGLYNQFLIGQNLLLQYKNRSKTASEIFDISALAKYYAICDVFQGIHGISWHNQRFYYNPVLCKLEPIAYDHYTEDGFFNWANRTFFGRITYNSIGKMDDDHLIYRELFNNYSFLDEYIKYLELYSSDNFLKQVKNEYELEGLYYDSLIRIEFPECKLNISGLYQNASNIKNELDSFKLEVAEQKKNNKKWKNISKTEKIYTTGLDRYYAKNLVVVYNMKNNGDSILIRVVNYFTDPVLLLGVGRSSKKITEYLHPEPKLSAHNYKEQSVFECWVYKGANFLFFMAGNDKSTITKEIMQWPEPDGSPSPIQDLLSKNKFPDPQLVESVDQGRVKVKNGSVVIDHPVIIPKGYELVIDAGTKIDLINEAMIISYSPVFMKGESNQPIQITSSDFSGNGITILQADKRSIIEHVLFENLNTLDYKGWVLTGAVTFYESDVDITNTLFYRNQCEDALNIIRSEFTLDNSSFEYIYGDAFDSDFSSGVVLNTEFKNIGNDAIDFSGSRILIKNVLIEDAIDKGISGGEESFLTVENTTIKRAGIGLASKDLSVVKFENGEIEDCKYGLVLLQKKPEYGSATVIFNNSKIVKPEIEMLIEMGSIVEKDGKTFKGKKEKLADIFYE